MRSGASASDSATGRASAIRRLAVALGYAAVLLVGSTSANAADIAISQAWSHAIPKGAKVAAGYLTIENRGDGPDRLLSASTPIAGKVAIHEMREVDGIMKMRPMSGGLTIPPNAKLVFAPGGSHLMFTELRSSFSEGEHVPVSLDFEKAGKITISLEVGSIGAKGPQLGEGAVHSTAGGADPFFTHIHDGRVMANVTVSPGRSGPVEVLVQLEDAQEKPLTAEGLSVTLSSPDSRLAPITVSAERVASDTWRARMFVSEGGKLTLALEIALTSREQIEVAAPILIE